jgi:hypothetical protein
VGGNTKFLDDTGAMADAIRAFDWSATSLGPIEGWPAVLKTTVGLILASKFPTCIVWGPKMVTIHNDAFRPILGSKPDALGRTFEDVWYEAWDFIGPMVEKALAGEATFIEDYGLILERNGYPEQAYFTFCYSPIRDEDGTVVGMMDTVIETTAKVRAQKIGRLLNSELAHRARNLLAIVTAVVEQTFRTSDSKEAAHGALTKRIMALAQAQEILSQSNWSSAPIRSVIQGALIPHRTGEGRIAIDGPPIDLTPSQS